MPLTVVALAAFAACGGDGGSPVQPTPTGGTPTDTASDTTAARRAVDAWLALVDAWL